MGNPAAHRLSFDQVARELSQPLLRYLRHHVGNQAVAEDILQETLVRISRGFDSYAGRASVRTWAFAIARRAAADHFRRTPRHALVDETAEETELPGTDRPVDEQLIADEMNACLREAIGILPEDYRTALVLHDLEGLSTEQTARKCGCSLPTAKIRIHRARHRLKKTLQRQCQFYRDEDDVFRCDRIA